MRVSWAPATIVPAARSIPCLSLSSRYLASQNLRFYGHFRIFAGIVTDGGFRDSPEIAELAIPAYHNRPAAPTNITHHQALDINVPIGCGDVAVWPGDAVVGDAAGVVIIPAALAEEIAAEAVEMTVFEDFVTEEVLKGRSILGLYPPTEAQSRIDFAAWRQRARR